MRQIVFALAFLLGLLARPAVAQEVVADQKFLVAVDTAGITPAGIEHVYITWVYALSSPTSFPSSGILVAFNCQNRKVARMAHVKYEWNDDSTGVQGPIIEEPMLQWVDVTIPALYDLVCRIGPTKPEPVSSPQPPAWDGTISS